MLKRKATKNKIERWSRFGFASNYRDEVPQSSAGCETSGVHNSIVAIAEYNCQRSRCGVRAEFGSHSTTSLKNLKRSIRENKNRGARTSSTRASQIQRTFKAHTF